MRGILERLDSRGSCVLRLFHVEVGQNGRARMDSPHTAAPSSRNTARRGQHPAVFGYVSS